jgi:hypothetical protein
VTAGSFEGSHAILRLPKAIKYFPDSNTTILEYFSNSVDLKAYLSEHEFSSQLAYEVGSMLGEWAARFHAWGRAPEQKDLQELLIQISEAALLKSQVNGGRLESTADEFPAILGQSRDLFPKIRKRMKSRETKTDNGIIHGDFWTGKYVRTALEVANFYSILLPRKLFDTEIPETKNALSLAVLDWELCHVSSPIFDIGQMFAELYLLYHFRQRQCIAGIVKSFVDSYRQINPLHETDAFDIMLQCGVHLIVWPWRAGWERGAVMDNCITFGRDVLQHAYENNASWFSNGIFGSLFGEER